jgi:hypothetical protein
MAIQSFLCQTEHSVVQKDRYGIQTRTQFSQVAPGTPCTITPFGDKKKKKKKNGYGSPSN